MNRGIALACLVGCALAVPIEKTRELVYSTSVNADAFFDSMDMVAVGRALESKSQFGAVQVELSSDSRRQLQSGARTVKINYKIKCGTNCDAIGAKLAVLVNDPAAGLAHAQSIIAAINTVAVAAGFTTPVVLSQPADIQAS